MVRYALTSSAPLSNDQRTPCRFTTWRDWLHARAVPAWYVDPPLAEKMHSRNIHCNVYFADTLEDFDLYFGMGIDTILTNRMDIARSYRKRNKDTGLRPEPPLGTFLKTIENPQIYTKRSAGPNPALRLILWFYCLNCRQARQ